MSEPGQFLSDTQDHFGSHQLSLQKLDGVGGLPKERPISPLELSRALQARLGEVRGVDTSRAADAPEELTARLRMNIEAMHVELAELLHETPWKDWKSYPDDWYTNHRMAAIQEEMIDLYFFLNNMFIAVGMGDSDIQQMYELKFEKNMQRQADTDGSYR